MKKIALALSTAIVLATGVSGAYAASAYGNIGACDPLPGDSSSWSTTALSDKLTEDGISFDSIGIANGCFSVIRTTEDGAKVMDLYSPDTLNKIQL